jgi:SlyX protein
MGRELWASLGVTALAPLRPEPSVVSFVTQLNHSITRGGDNLVSNSAMDHSPHTDQRLTDLEVKASFAEDQLEQLDTIIIRQQAQIDLLMREVAALKERSARSPLGKPAAQAQPVARQ